MSQTTQRPDGDVSADQLKLLGELLAAYPRRDWHLDQTPDGDDDGIYGYVETTGICAPSTEQEIAAGADETHEIGDLHPIAAARLAVAAVNTLPALLAEVTRRRNADTVKGLFADSKVTDAIAQIIRDAPRGQARPDCGACVWGNGPCSEHAPADLAAHLVDAIRRTRVFAAPSAAATGAT